jgi:thiol-disulfide isomerase/thioredoxin
MRRGLILLTFGLMGACATVPADTVYDAQTVLSVQGLDCQGCGQRIMNEMEKLKGVANTSFDKQSVEVTVSYRKAEVSPADLVKAVEKAGFSGEIGASKGAYRPNLEFNPAHDVVWLTHTGEMVDVTKERVLGKVTVIDFGADWCGPCRRVDAHMKKVLNAHADVALRKIDISDWDSPISQAYLKTVPQLPYLIVYGKDGREVTRFGGFDLERLDKAIEAGRHAP